MKNQEKKKSKKPLVIVVGLLVIMLIIGATYWIQSSHYESTDNAQLDGNIYSIRSSVTAYLDEIYFKDNAYVHQGDTLLIFDTIALKAQVEKAKAALVDAKTKLSVSDIQASAKTQNAKAAKQSNLSGKETIEAAYSRLNQAQKEIERDKKLLKIQAITPKQYEADKTTLVQSQTAYETAKLQHQSATITTASLQFVASAAHHQISSAQALVEQCKAQLKLAEENLRHAYVIAPCNGIVTKRAVDPEQYVMAGQSLCAIVDADHLWVTANFKETKLALIATGQPVEINLDAYPDITLKGKVASFSGATGAKFALIPPDNATGNFIKVTQRFPLRITLDSSLVNQTKKQHKELFPGLSAEVKIKIN